MRDIKIIPVDSHWHEWAALLLESSWGSVRVVSRGVLHDASQMPGFIAFLGDEPLGLVTYHISGNECEIVTINSLRENQGIGSALVEAVRREAIRNSCRRVWLITTNDNLPALRFYQKRGFHLVAVHPNALAESRRLKPEIPITGLDGLPLRDEIELELPI